MAEPTNFEQTYYTILMYGFKDKNGTVYQGDQAAIIQPGNIYVGVTSDALSGFPLIDYNSYYQFYFNEKILDLEVTHAEWVGLDGVEHSIDCDEIYFEKEVNNPYGNFVLKYQGEKQTRVPAGTVAHLGITVIEGIEVHLDNYVTISPVCYEQIIPGAGTRKMVTLSFNNNISDYRKETYPASAAFEYEYSISDYEIMTALLDAQLKGQYWDPEGNAGKPGETGGGLGDYRRPDYEIGIPALPEVSAADTGFIGIYKVTASEIQDLAADLWTDNFWNTIIKNFEDPFNNIISLSLIPYDQLTGTLTQIMVGNFQSSAAGNKLTTTFYEVDCGIININEYYGTYADYTLTKIQLYLPFCQTIDINPDDVMDGKIRVVYHIDIFSGCCVAYVQTITKGAWHVLYQVEGNIKSELPINARNYMGVYTGIAKGMLGMVGAAATGNIMGAAGSAIDTIANSKPSYQRSGSAGGSAAMLGILYPYLIFSTPQIFVPDNFKKLKGYVSNQKVKIGDQTGYLSAAVTNDDLINFNATVEEKSMIASLLSEGIRIEKEDQ